MPSSWKTIRVFISSTFKDMQAERDHLVRFVFPKLREELLKHRIHLVDVDLRWGVTSDQDALGVCREVIDECHPQFMCILGGRYGWVPEGKDKSITADEVHYGVLDRAVAKRGRAFFYFRADQATAEMVEETPGEYREPEGSGNAGKLAALKKSIKDAGLPVVEYRARWSKDQKRLIDLENFGNHVHADLLQSLKEDPELADHFTDDSTATPDEFADERDQMEAFIEERVDQYVLGSREPLMNDLLAFASTDGTPNILVLTGAPGSGKSALLAKFYRSLPVSSSPSLLVSHFVGASTGSTDLRRTMRRLCHELAEVAGNTEPLPLDIKELIIHFQKLLNQAAAKQRVILVFDALNQFDETDGAHWMNWLPRELPSGIRIIASVIAPTEGEKEHQTLAILRIRQDARVESLKPLNESDTEAIIEGYLKRYSKRLSPEQIAALKEKPASSLPLYVLTALEELRTLGTDEQLTALASKALFPPSELERLRREDHDAILAKFISAELPGTAVELFKWILKTRLAQDPILSSHPDGASALVKKLAACLGVSRHGLSPAELTALLDPGDPLGNVAALLRLLRPYLMRRGELLDFYHGQFREAARAAYLDTPEKQRAAHQSVAACLQAFADPHRDGQFRDPTPHALSELPHHQTRAEAWPDLIATLENIFFLEAKVTHGMAFDLVEEFTAAVDALPPEHAERQRLRLLDEALRRDLHFIARHSKDYPQALFQCLWNSAWWFDCPDAVQHYGNRQRLLGSSDQRLCDLLEEWRQEKERASHGFCWLRSRRPPSMHLGSAQLAVLQGHTGAVMSVCYAPNGQSVISGSDDRSIRVWDADSGAELAVLRGHQHDVSSIGYSPVGHRIVSGSFDHTVRVWDAVSGAELAVLRGHQRDVRSVGYSPDGRRIVSGSGDDTVRIWDVDSSTELAVLCGHQGSVNSVSYSPDGRHIVSGSCDDTVRIWDTDSRAELAVLHGHQSAVTSVSYSPDGRRIVSGSHDKTIRIWDAAKGVELAVLRVHDDAVSSVGYSPDGRRIVSGAWDNTIRVWDTETGMELTMLRGQERKVTSVRYSPDGHRIVSGSDDKAIRVWDPDSKPDKRELRGHEDRLWNLCYSPDGSRLVTGAGDKTVRVWDTDSGVELAVLRGHQWEVASVAYSPDGRRIVSGSCDNTLRVWDADSGAELAVLRGHTGSVWSVGYTNDGEWIVSASVDNTDRVWDTQTYKCIEVIHGAEGVTAIGSGLAAFPLRLRGISFETVLEEVSTGREIAWLPLALEHLTSNSSGLLWAGNSANYLALIQLEGRL